MQIIVNNEKMEVPEYFTIEELLKKMSYSRHVAVWINGTQIWMKDYSSRKLNHKDNIRIIRPLGGG